MNSRALALTGPTTSGKTALGLALARRLDAEIISMDSRQVYRAMDIGTDKVTAEERRGIPHFGLDLVDPDQSYSAGRFARDVRRWVDEIELRGHVPLLVGGTGFFLRAVLEPVFQEPALDPARRAALRGWLDARPLDELAGMVERLDPARASLAIEGGRQRLSRTLEVALLTGRPLSWWHREAPPDGPAIPCLVVCLELPREELDRRIDVRVSHMVERGLLEEVRALLDAGYGPDDPGMTGTGYREIVAVLRGEMALPDALDEMRRQTRRYARRQGTWFRNQLPSDTLRLDAREDRETLLDRIVAVWNDAVARPRTKLREHP
ncbi:MAG: tRNA (adenosine(37)-N6)-dimethylallyltransferase MiaA [Gemmatimonadetes bacterium]|nr:tRNA (adenosine(37)-N6)-dimethylallyltransferase MiaA [Gemmatimonadota bacterium]NNK62742.1 tRNA (adenosine(37)-N6)-dimethylallyltransferase MiaA [Gemmatimonadota bacterium]